MTRTRIMRSVTRHLKVYHKHIKAYKAKPPTKLHSKVDKNMKRDHSASSMHRVQETNTRAYILSVQLVERLDCDEIFGVLLL